jgi:N-sulfoglucosamine sulfohydrolase
MTTTLFALYMTAALTAAESASSPAGPRPNILWITAEDICPDLGCYGDPQARTPNIDKLAGQGARFINAFSVAGVCAPSRSALITGMYPTTIGTHHMRCKGVPPSYVKCFTEYLRAAGYYCTNNVKTDYNFDTPLTAWDECSNTAHWRNRPHGRSFFSVFNFTVCHEGQIRAPAAQFARNIKALKAADRHDPAKTVLPPYYPDTPIVRNDWARYYDLITAMDLQVADLLRQLTDDDLADNTIVFFYGDNGRGLPRGKRWVYDSGIHVPLIVRWPGIIKPGTVCDDLVSFIDFGPTVLSLAGVKVPGHMQGRSFLGEQAAPPREYIFAARDRMDETYDIIRAVRDKRFKYIRNLQACKPYAQYIDYMDKMPTMQEMRRLNKEGKLLGPQRLFFLPEKPQEELYDTVADPHEINNLASHPDHRKTLERLRTVLDQWMKDTNDLGLIPEAELNERVRPGGNWSVTAAPVITPNGGAFSGPPTVKIACPTEGASIAWTTDSGNSPHWNLYSQPIILSASATLRAQACRLGWKDNSEAQAVFRISPPEPGR